MSQRSTPPMPLWFKLLRSVDRGSRWLLFLCVGVYVGNGCMPVNSRVEQRPTETASSQPAGPLSDNPVSTTGPQALTGGITTGIQSSIQTYMPWTLVLLLLFNTLIHNFTIRYMTSIHADNMKHTIDTLAKLTSSLQQAEPR